MFVRVDYMTLVNFDNVRFVDVVDIKSLKGDKQDKCKVVAHLEGETITLAYGIDGDEAEELINDLCVRLQKGYNATSIRFGHIVDI